jgi:hypothetical protein
MVLLVVPVVEAQGAIHLVQTEQAVRAIPQALLHLKAIMAELRTY